MEVVWPCFFFLVSEVGQLQSKEKREKGREKRQLRRMKSEIRERAEINSKLVGCAARVLLLSVPTDLVAKQPRFCRRKRRTE